MRDQDVVEGLLRLERRSVAIYEALASSAELRGRAAAAADLFLAHERRHVEALKQALVTMNAAVPAPGSAGEQPAGAPREMIRTAIDHELRCIRSYHSGQVTLKAPTLLAGAAGTMANEAQHLAFLRGLLGEDPVPVAFVTGR
ncbi:MAG TPA: ferritin-like domain-containing protein [Thermoleophilaceae bacterium]|nr:ferritin-like domain-containing protein [Thermoleophilaceae bacterium]